MNRFALLLVFSWLASAASAQSPTISFLTPANGATVLDTFVAAGSSTNATVVELRVDAGPFVTANGLAPWDVVFESGSIAPGPHTLTARASNGAATASTSIQITVGTPPPGSQTITYLSSVDAVPMTARLWLPTGFQPGGAPRALVVYLHGGGGTGAGMLTAGQGAMTGQLDARGWIGLAPDGRAWGLASQGCPWQTSAAYVNNPNPAVGPGEQDILDAIDWALASFPIDVDRVYLMGFSMGGRGTYGIGLRNPDRFAAIAPLSPASDMFEIFVRRPDPVACKEGMVGGPAGASAFVDTMYTITSGRFLIENAAALPVFHGHGTLDNVANNVPSSGIYLHGYHMTNNGTWSSCHGSTTFCFGHTPTLQELRTRHPEGYDWAFLFAPVTHVQTPEFFLGANVGAAGVQGVVDPLSPGHLLGMFDFFAPRTRVHAPDLVVYKTYTDVHRRAYWLELDSSAPWSRSPAAVRAQRDVVTNLVAAELVRANNLTIDVATAELRIAANEPLRVTLAPLVEPTFDPALVDPSGTLVPTLKLRGDFSGFDWVRVLLGGTQWPGAVTFSASEVVLGPVAVGSAAAFEIWPVRAFTDIGGALAGTSGAPAHLAIASLQPGTPGQLNLAGGASGALSALVFGFTAAQTPLLGGTLVPAIDVALLGVNDGSGARSEAFVWPAGMPANVHLYSQYLVLDAGAPQGVAFSNALEWTTRP